MEDAVIVLSEQDKADLREFLASGQYQLDRQPLTYNPQELMAEAMSRVGKLPVTEVKKLLASWAKNKALNVQLMTLARQRDNITIG